MKFGTIVKVVAVNLALIAVILVAVELIFGSWFSNTHALYQFTKPRNIAMTQANPFGDVPPEIRYTRDANGFRGLDGPVDDIDIITVGGSTTDQRFLDDSATFQAVLRDRFAAEGREIHIANAGIDGQSTVGHIYNFPSWFSRIEGLRTRFVLYYVGINDMLRLGATDLYDEVAVADPGESLRQFIREKSFFYQLYIVAKSQLQPTPYAHWSEPDYVVDPANAVDRGNLERYDTPEIQQSLAALRERVIELDKLTRDIGAVPIFVTQRSGRWAEVDGKIIGIPKYLEGEGNEFASLGEVNGVDIHHIERLVAGAIMEACRANAEAICLDLMSEIAFRLPDDFYDPIHTTSSGSLAIGEYLFDKLRGVI